MQRYIPAVIVVSLITSVLLLRCELFNPITDSSVLKSQDSVLYRYTFESPEDTAGWHGYGAAQLRKDVPSNGGEHALYVSGGCIIPHVVFDLSSLNTDSYLQLRGWGKAICRGGAVLLKIRGDSISTSTGFAIMDSTWHRYSSEPVFYPAGDALALSFYSGGIVPGAMLIDNIEIVKVAAPTDSLSH